MVGSAHPTGTTSLKMWVKRSLKVLLVVFFTVLNAHNFKRVEPLRGILYLITPMYLVARSVEIIHHLGLTLL
ncbi:hypothetical protein Cha6605_4984 [Chamaesiphon minutus PCC 6605]|uniref:Uncharacterized protein n=1 Tax=Chamaesiphon minutus (strain ATCC 27169 / PCC 6605) TaxID=1173020 RepID=K9UN86_CHAP6|nr:hypothetical protein Cha6605_4984 [Chamaesiphon minutus PCC 6605]